MIANALLLTVVMTACSGVALASDRVFMDKAEVQSSLSPRSEGELWRVTRNAGISAMFLMLNGHGLEKSYESVKAAFRASPRGSSVADLCEGGSALGVNLVASESGPQELKHLTLPVIAYLDPSAGKGAGGGRFVVITGWDAGDLVVYDAVTAVPALINVSEFLREWSGVLVTLASPNLETAIIDAGLAVFGALLTFIVAWLCRVAGLTMKRWS